jgi:hypothetical protein
MSTHTPEGAFVIGVQVFSRGLQKAIAAVRGISALARALDRNQALVSR